MSQDRFEKGKPYLVTKTPLDQKWAKGLIGIAILNSKYTTCLEFDNDSTRRIAVVHRNPKRTGAKCIPLEPLSWEHVKFSSSDECTLVGREVWGQPFDEPVRARIKNATWDICMQYLELELDDKAETKSSIPRDQLEQQLSGWYLVPELEPQPKPSGASFQNVIMGQPPPPYTFVEGQCCGNCDLYGYMCHNWKQTRQTYLPEEKEPRRCGSCEYMPGAVGLHCGHASDSRLLFTPQDPACENWQEQVPNSQCPEEGRYPPGGWKSEKSFKEQPVSDYSKEDKASPKRCGNCQHFMGSGSDCCHADDPRTVWGVYSPHCGNWEARRCECLAGCQCGMLAGPLAEAAGVETASGRDGICGDGLTIPRRKFCERWTHLLYGVRPCKCGSVSGCMCEPEKE
jgi:hypothetical protein